VVLVIELSFGGHSVVEDRVVLVVLVIALSFGGHSVVED